MSNQDVKRYAVVTTWTNDCEQRIGEHLEEHKDGIYMLVADYDTMKTRLRDEAVAICHEVTAWGCGVLGALSNEDTSEWLSEECARRITALTEKAQP